MTIILTGLTDVDSYDQKNEKALFAFVVFGFGELVGSLLIGYVVDSYNSRVASILNMIEVWITVALTLLFLYEPSYNTLTFAMAFMWGV